MKKIFVTGGHFAPAEAVIQELISRGGWKIYYVGRKHSMEDEKAVALEYTEIQKFAEVKYLTIISGRLQRQFFTNTLQSVRSVLKVFIGLFQAFSWLIIYRPNVILSFGGYVAVPVVLSAWFFRIKIITHEQTTVYGRSNKLISQLADRVLVSWPESLRHFPINRVALTGNPIRPEILNQQPTPGKGRALIYVTGGSQGAHTINVAVEKILPDLLKKYSVIHQAGDAGRYRDFERLSRISNKFYQVRRQLSAQESAKTLNKARLVISRAGANTISELLALGKMAILIPLPYSFGQEQEKNAMLAVGAGIAKVIHQDKLRSKELLSEISLMLQTNSQFDKNISRAKKLISQDAATLIVNEVEALTDKPPIKIDIS